MRRLVLLVNPNGTRWWRYKFRFSGVEKSLALGSFPAVSLKEARDGRDAARQLLKAGRDPAAERQNAKRDIQVAATNLFETVARKFAEDRQGQKWTDEYAKAMVRRLELNIFPDLGQRPIAEVTPSELLAVLQKIEERGCHELAHRMQQACTQFLHTAGLGGKCT